MTERMIEIPMKTVEEMRDTFHLMGKHLNSFMGEAELDDLDAPSEPVPTPTPITTPKPTPTPIRTSGRVSVFRDDFDPSMRASSANPPSEKQIASLKDNVQQLGWNSMEEWGQHIEATFTGENNEPLTGANINRLEMQGLLDRVYKRDPTIMPDTPIVPVDEDDLTAIPF